MSDVDDTLEIHRRHQFEHWARRIESCYESTWRYDRYLIGIKHLYIFGLAYCLPKMRIHIMENCDTMPKELLANLKEQQHHLENIYKLFATSWTHRQSWTVLSNRLNEIPEHNKLNVLTLTVICIHEMIECIEFYEKFLLQLQNVKFEDDMPDVSWVHNMNTCDDMLDFYKNIMNELTQLYELISLDNLVVGFYYEFDDDIDDIERQTIESCSGTQRAV
jgi:hypothetical protein